MCPERRGHETGDLIGLIIATYIDHRYLYSDRARCGRQWVGRFRSPRSILRGATRIDFCRSFVDAATYSSL